MGNLRRKYQTFLLRNRNKGIQNLMLYVGIGNIIVYLFSIFNEANLLYQILRFDAVKILYHGEIWRIFSYIFTFAFEYSGSALSILLLLLSSYFYHWLGKTLENAWGTLRLNIYYFRGLILTSLLALLCSVFFELNWAIYVTPYYLNLSLFLAVATLAPNNSVLLFMIFPIKMRWLAILDIGLIFYDLFRYIQFIPAPTWQILIIFGLAPAISLLNYVFSHGKYALTLFGIQPGQRKSKQQFRQKTQPNPDWARNYRNAAGERPYRHKCTVCGRTDTSCPGLEFRYCSRCKGYFCYCIDHINNHTHVE